MIGLSACSRLVDSEIFGCCPSAMVKRGAKNGSAKNSEQVSKPPNGKFL